MKKVFKQLIAVIGLTTVLSLPIIAIAHGVAPSGANNIQNNKTNEEKISTNEVEPVLNIINTRVAYASKKIIVGKPTIKVTKSGSNAKITWKKTKNAAKYQVYRKYYGGSWKKVYTTSKLSYTDKNVKKNVKVYYKVRAYYKNGSKVYYGKFSDYKSVKFVASASSKKPYTDYEVWMLSHIIYAESGICDDTEQRYVGSVVLNRVRNSAFPNTLEGVLLQKGQYYGSFSHPWFAQQPSNKAIANAKWLLTYGSILPIDVVYQARRPLTGKVYIQTRWHYYCYI